MILLPQTLREQRLQIGNTTGTFLLEDFVCMCVAMYACGYICIYLSIDGGPRPTFSAFLQETIHLVFLRQPLTGSWGLADEAGWSLSPGILLSVPPQCWDYKCTPRHLCFLWALGKDSGPGACTACMLLIQLASQTRTSLFLKEKLTLAYQPVSKLCYYGFMFIP